MTARDTYQGILSELAAAWVAAAPLHGFPPSAVPEMAFLQGPGGFRRWTSTPTLIALPRPNVSTPVTGSDLLVGLLHEVAHAMCLRDLGRDGTSRQGRYHGKEFGAVAEHLGLRIVQGNRSLGFGVHALAPRDGFQGEWAGFVVRLDALLAKVEADVEADVEREPSSQLTRATGQPERRIGARCGCGRTLRMYGRAFALAPIRCEACGQPFVAVGA